MKKFATLALALALVAGTVSSIGCGGAPATKAAPVTK